MPVKLKCEECKKSFKVSPSRKESATFCSRECQSEHMSKNQNKENNPNWKGRIEKQCKKCLEKFKVRPSDEDQKFCSIDCRYSYLSEHFSGKENPNWVSKKEKKCLQCGKTMKLSPYYYEKTKYCSTDCHDKWRSINQAGESHHQYKERIKLECKQCGKNFDVRPCAKQRSYCSKKCHDIWRSKNLKNNGNPNWKGGHPNYYGDNWEDMRQKALQRDNHKCCVCKRGKEEMGREPDVHHITPIREFDNPENANYLDNLVTLCKSHHSMVEGWGLKPDIRNTNQ